MRKDILAVIIVWLGIMGWFFYEKPSPPFAGAIPEMLLDKKTVQFSYTDNNSNENMVIRLASNTHKENDPIYFSIENATGRAQNATVVFALKDNKTQVATIQEFISNSEITLLSSASQPIGTKTVTNWSNKTPTEQNEITLENSIKNKPGISKKLVVGSYYPGITTLMGAGATKYFKAILDAPPNLVLGGNTQTTQEFYIEAFGDDGGYGHSF